MLRFFLPIYSNSFDAMNDKTLNETTSPIDAANGVAKLSGFIWNRCDNKITATNTKSISKSRKNHKRKRVKIVAIFLMGNYLFGEIKCTIVDNGDNIQ